MATQLSQAIADEHQTNETPRDELIREAVRTCAGFQARLKTLNDEFKEYRTTVVKGRLGFKLADWALLQRLYDLGDDDRSTTIQVLREGFTALSIGEQLDWVTVTENAVNGAGPGEEEEEEDQDQDQDETEGGPAPAEASDEEPPWARQQEAMGYEAGRNGRGQDSNPHREGSSSADAWERGRMKAQTEMAMELGGGSAPSVAPRRRGRPPGRKDSKPGQRVRRGVARANLLN